MSTQPSAPRWIWLAVLVAEALRRVVPEGRLARGVAVLRLASYAVLIAIARYLAAHAPTSRVRLQTFTIARRLRRGDALHGSG